MKPDRFGNPIVPYDPRHFDEGYYMRGERGGFPGLRWEDESQQEQLEYKRQYLARFEPYLSVLFVGCARGLEVRKMREVGKQASGIDVSAWAIASADLEVLGDVSLYDGEHIPRADDSVDVVAAFDVLPLIPDASREIVCREMVRVARKGICFRCIIKDYRHLHDPCDGLDGVSFRYSTFEWLDAQFSGGGKFRVARLEMTGHYESVFWFERVP